jgi:arginyl-tRNA synthetase
MKQQLEAAIQAVAQQTFDEDVTIDLTRPDEQFGDFSTNIALQLAGKLGKNPREVAEILTTKLREQLGDHIKDVSLAGPGFINIVLTDQSLAALALSEAAPTTYVGQKVVIETNNPNPFKAMHIGHSFNAIVGDTLANLLEKGGAETHRVSYHGDVGTHVGKSMWSLLKFIDGDPAKLQTVPVDERNVFMSKMYAEGSTAYKEDEAVKAEVERLAEASFTLDDPVYKEVYETCKAWSFELLDATIARLGCQPTEKKYMESDADAMGVATVQAHTGPGNVFKESDNALIFEGEQYGSYTNVFVSSRGRGLYGARDLGLMQLKHTDYQANKSYIVTAEEQKAYFKGVIKAAELCLPELSGVTVNLSTGTVKLATGKMSSRDGNVLDIAWLFEQVEQAIRNRGGEPTPETVVGALHYQFLKVRIGSDVLFDVDEAVALVGNSGPYLQYAYARAQSILRKSSATAADLSESTFDVDERSLVRKLGEYSDAVQKAVAELMPHQIASYLYELAQAFNRFYEHNRVIDDPREALRLSLVAQYAKTLKAGLKILGISAPEQM